MVIPWNYTLELFFWIILGAIFFVSITILLGRPPKSSPVMRENNRHTPWSVRKEPEKEIGFTAMAIGQGWTIGFPVFGPVFVLIGGAIMLFSDFEFTFLIGSSMIFIGIGSLFLSPVINRISEFFDNRYVEVSGMGLLIMIWCLLILFLMIA